MISNRKLITAAHCFEDALSASIQIGDSAANLRSIDGIIVYIHPDYTNPDNTSNRNDIAILELSENANLPTMPILIGSEIEKNEILSIFGYGEDDTGEVSRTLQSGEMKVSDVNNNFIKALYNGEGSNVCFGDSGGPLVADVNGTASLVGTTSFGTRSDCQPGDTTSFINLQSESALNFINEKAPEANFR
jgi:secreted trypsin-like serine protease